MHKKMTVKGLREKLSTFDENMEIKIAIMSRDVYDSEILYDDDIAFYDSSNDERLTMEISPYIGLYMNY